MSFPSPSLPAPPLADYQMRFKGLTFAGVVEDSRYQLVKLPKGIDVAAVVGGDVQRALDQGELAGLDLLGGRDIEVEQVVTANEGSLDDARQKLAAVMALGGAIETPLYLQLPSGAYACMARPRRHACGISVNTLVANGEIALSMLHATDPRWYAVPTKEALTGSGVPLGGFTFDAEPPFHFEPGIEAGTITCRNNGTIEMRPIFVVTGPCTNPRLRNLSVGGAELGFAIALAEEDRLIIDTDFQTVVYVPAGSTTGVSRRSSLIPGSKWFNFPPGVNLVEFAASSGTLTAQWADAYAGL